MTVHRRRAGAPRDESDPDDPPRVSFDELLRRGGRRFDPRSC